MLKFPLSRWKVAWSPITVFFACLSCVRSFVFKYIVTLVLQNCDSCIRSVEFVVYVHLTGTWFPVEASIILYIADASTCSVVNGDPPVYCRFFVVFYMLWLTFFFAWYNYIYIDIYQVYLHVKAHIELTFILLWFWLFGPRFMGAGAVCVDYICALWVSFWSSILDAAMLMETAVIFNVWVRTITVWSPPPLPPHLDPPLW